MLSKTLTPSVPPKWGQAEGLHLVFRHLGLLFFVALPLLLWLSLENYLLYHAAVEILAGVVAVSIFTVGWNTRGFSSTDPFLTVAASSYLVVGVLDILHMLTYKGMGVFPGSGANLPTQIWVAGRYIEALSLLGGSMLLKKERQVSANALLPLYLLLGALTLVAIFGFSVFPTCYDEQAGTLTPFKILGEYVVAACFVAAAVVLRASDGRCDQTNLNILVTALLIRAVSELSFTLYQDVYGLGNLIGHALKFLGLTLTYTVLVQNNLRQPYRSLFRRLTEANEHLEAELAQRRATEERLSHLNSVLKAMRSIDRLVQKERNTQQLIQQACNLLTTGRGYYSAWIVLYDEQGEVQQDAQSGMDDRFGKLMSQIQSAAPPDCVTLALRRSEVTAISDPAVYCEKCALAHYFQDRGALFTRLEHNNRTYGIICASVPRHLAADEEEKSLFKELAADIALAVHHIETEESANEAERYHTLLNGTLEALAKIVGMRDSYTAMHQQRVALLAGRIAETLELPKERVQEIRMGALLHDIGKIIVPAEILNKPSRLSELEFDLIKQHPRTGYDIIASIGFPKTVPEVVLYHHERLNGTGYPEGLRGNQIPQPARIVAVADVIEAMAFHRPYRPARGINAALKEIEEGAGRLYDEEAARACIRLFRHGFTFTDEVGHRPDSRRASASL